MHQLDRIEQMLIDITGPSENHIRKSEIKKLVEDMFGFLRDGKKIDAIKNYRTLTGMGLKESKDAIESLRLVPGRQP